MSRIRIAAAMFIVACGAGVSAEAARHDVFHRAVGKWLERRPDEALAMVEKQLVRSAPLQERDDHALLENLAARLRLARLRGRLATREQQVDELERIEELAAKAVADAPSDPSLWNDYIAIMEERQALARATPRAEGARIYGRHRRMAMLATKEHQVIAKAVLAALHGREVDAADSLRRHIRETRTPVCESAVILAHLELGMDRLESARAAMASLTPECRGRAGTARVQVRVDAAVADAYASSFVEERYREYLVIDTVDEHWPDVALEVLRNPSRVSAWCELWRITRFNAETQRNYDRVVDLAAATNAPSRQLEMLGLYATLGRGDYRSAHMKADGLLRTMPDSAEVNAVYVLSGAVLGGGLVAHRGAYDRIRGANPYLAGCMNSEQLALCLARDGRCSTGKIVCNDASEFLFQAFDSGLRRHDPVSRLEGKLERRIDAEAAARIRGEERLRNEMMARDDAQEARMDALRTRIDLAIEPELRRLRDDVKRTGRVLQAHVESERRERQTLRRDLERKTASMAKDIDGIREASSWTQGDVVRLQMRMFALEEFVKNIDPERDRIVLERFRELDPAAADKLVEQIVIKVKNALRYDESVQGRLVAIQKALRAGDYSTAFSESLRLMKKSGLTITGRVKINKHVGADWDFITFLDTMSELFRKT